jgi:integrase
MAHQCRDRSADSIAVSKGTFRLVNMTIDGQREVVAVQGAVPLVMPNLWTNHLQSVVRRNTAVAYLYDAMELHRWAYASGICLEERWRSMKGLTQSEVSRLGAHLKAVETTTEAAPSTVNRKLAGICRYVEYCMTFYIDLSFPDLARAEFGSVRLKSTLKQIRRLAFGEGTVAAHSRPAAVLSAQELDWIEAVFSPDGPMNPFESKLVKARNYCIYRLAKATWIRRSELVLLTLQDIELGASPSITIKRAESRSEKLRADGASMKTVGRKIPISFSEATLVATYLDTVRPGFAKAGHPSKELFLSSGDGRRLSSKTINKIFAQVDEVLRRQRGTLVSRVHPHAFRKTGANEFREAHYPLSNSIDSCVDGLAYKAGWSRRGKMPQHYTRDAMSEQLGQLVRSTTPKTTSS